MNDSNLEDLIKNHSKKLEKFLGLDRVIIKYKIQRSPDSLIRAECLQNVEYNLATIWMDSNFIEDESDFLDVLFHELGHILHRDFFLYRKYYYTTLSKGSESDLQETVIWNYCCERSIVALNYLWKNILKEQYRNDQS